MRAGLLKTAHLEAFDAIGTGLADKRRDGYGKQSSTSMLTPLKARMEMEYSSFSAHQCWNTKNG